MRQTIYGFLLGVITLTLIILLMSNAGDLAGTAANDADSATLKSEDERMLPQIVKSPPLYANYDFAGEALDMDNDDVVERLETELMRNTYFHRNTLTLLKRSSRFFPTIERILSEEGLPLDLKYISVAESDLATKTSPAGAKGYWQFMPAVGRAYGLQIDANVDERNHLEKSTRAACQLLKKYREQFGSWQLAAAAYNMGEGNMRKYLRIQRAERYEDLNINAETMAYLFRIVAIKSIMEEPRNFGFYLESDDYYAPLDDATPHQASATISDLALFAEEHGTSYRQLKRYNPWLISGSLPVSRGKEYTILLPQ